MCKVSPIQNCCRADPVQKKYTLIYKHQRFFQLYKKQKQKYSLFARNVFTLDLDYY